MLKWYFIKFALSGYEQHLKESFMNMFLID